MTREGFGLEVPRDFIPEVLSQRLYPRGLIPRVLAKTLAQETGDKPQHRQRH